MAYSSEVYSKVKRILEDRRSSAQRLSELKKADIYARFPEIMKLDLELSRNMADLSVLVLRGSENLESAIEKINAQNDAARLVRKRSYC